MTARATPGMSLSQREAQVAALVAQGMTDRQAAAELRVSVRTVHAHLRHVYAKAGVRSRVGLVSWLAARPPREAR